MRADRYQGDVCIADPPPWSFFSKLKNPKRDVHITVVYYRTGKTL